MKIIIASLGLLFTSVSFVACTTDSGAGEGEGEGEGEGDAGEGEGDASEGEGEGEGDFGGEGEGEGEIVAEGEGEGEGEGDPNVPEPGECRDSNDCGNGEFCVSPNSPPLCGVAPPESDCVNNSDCDIGLVCDFQYTCGARLACVPACDSDAACLEDETCVEGRCEAVSCLDGYVCPLHQVCGPRGSPLDPEADSHDCDFRSCTADNECPPTAVCIEGLCALSFGQCELPRP
jgi:hypothetical protein